MKMLDDIRNGWSEYLRTPVTQETTRQRAIRWAVFNGAAIALMIAGIAMLDVVAKPFWTGLLGMIVFCLAGMILGSNVSRWRMK